MDNAIATLMATLDDCKQQMPEGVYLQLCEKIQPVHQQRAQPLEPTVDWLTRGHCNCGTTVPYVVHPTITKWIVLATLLTQSPPWAKVRFTPSKRFYAQQKVDGGRERQ